MSHSPNGLFVRPSSSDDSRAIDAHRELSQREARDYRGRVQEVAPSSRTVCFVAGVGTTVFGSIELSQNSTDSWAITHVFVEKDAREIGIGDALVQYAMAFLQDEKATWIAGQAQPGDRALKNLFERHGLVAQTILVGRSLNDPSTAVDASQ